MSLNKVIPFLILALMGCSTSNETPTVGVVSQHMSQGGGGSSPLPGPQVCDSVTASPTEVPLASDVFIPESSTQVTNGERYQVSSDSSEYVDQLCHTQLLATTTHSKEYIVQCGLFQTLVWVGPHKKLVVDMGGHNSGFAPVVNGQLQGGGKELAQLLARIEALDPTKPIGAMVPSHPHADHTGNLLGLKLADPSIRVIVSKWYLREVEVNNLPLVTPIFKIPGVTVIRKRDGTFMFDGHQFGLHTPVAVAHTPADSIVITPGKSCMVVDILQPGRLVFVNMSVVQNVDGMITLLNYLGGLADAGVCEQGVWGHFNVSSGAKVKEDIDHAKEWIFDLHGAFWGALGSIQADGLTSDDFFPDDLEDDGNPSDPYDFHASAGISRLFDEIALRMHEILAPKYFERIGFSGSREHAKELLRFVFLHRLTAAVVDPSAPPGALPPWAFPSFDNIPYGTLPYNRYW